MFILVLLLIPGAFAVVYAVLCVVGFVSLSWDPDPNWFANWRADVRKNVRSSLPIIGWSIAVIYGPFLAYVLLQPLLVSIL